MALALSLSCATVLGSLCEYYIWVIYVTNVERRFATPSVAHWTAAQARHQRPGRPLLMAETVARASRTFGTYRVARRLDGWLAASIHDTAVASTTDDHLTVDDDAASVVCAR